MTEQKIVKMLEELHEARCAQMNLSAEANAAIRALIPPDVRDAMDTAQARFDAQADILSAETKRLEMEVKVATLRHGSKVRGVELQAIVTTRTRWDGDKLKGYAVANPDVLNFYSESQSVTIRKT